MQKVFVGWLAVVVVLYALAQASLDRPDATGVVRMSWATDPNPARAVQASLFSEMYPGREVFVDPGLGGDQTKLIVQCATGVGPDIVDVYSQQQLSNLVQSGILLDLTPHAERMGFAPRHTYPSVEDALKVEGRQYCFPANVWANCVIYNRAIFDDHGVPYPEDGWTYEQFVSTAKRIRDAPSRSGQSHLAVAHWMNTWVVQDLLMGHGGRMFTDDGLRSALDEPPALATMRLYHRLMHVDRVLPTPAEAASLSSQGGWGSGGINWFSTGKAAMIFIGRWYIVQAKNYPGLADDLGAVRLPRIGDRASQGIIGTRSAAINAQSPHAHEVLNFLQYLATPEYSGLIVADGDALPPNPARARTGADLVNKIVGDPSFHQPFIEAVTHGRALDVSPYINGALVERWLRERIEQVENGLIGPDEAMRQLATEINARIRRNLERQPDLQRKAGRTIVSPSPAPRG